MSYELLCYSSYTLGEYSYPYWANVLGWLIAASSMVAVPVLAIYHLVRLPGSPRQVRHRVFLPTTTSDGARCLKVGNLPGAFHVRRTREFGGESGDLPSP